MAVLPHVILSSDVFRKVIHGKLLYFLAPLDSPRASGAYFYPCLRLTLAIILLRFGIPRMDVFLFRQVSPAPCSPPLGGSIADSAVRFTPAVKYGGRENRLSRRETRCISSHPCRAHHKLKWARKGRSVIAVLYSHLPRSESNKAICAATPLPADAPPPTQTPQGQPLLDRGWQQPLNHHKAQPARRVKDAEGTAKPLVLDSVRWLGYLPGEYIRTLRISLL